MCDVKPFKVVAGQHALSKIFESTHTSLHKGTHTHTHEHSHNLTHTQHTTVSARGNRLSKLFFLKKVYNVDFYQPVGDWEIGGGGSGRWGVNWCVIFCQSSTLTSLLIA